jgi:hypothetical protein
MQPALTATPAPQSLSDNQSPEKCQLAKGASAKLLAIAIALRNRDSAPFSDDEVQPLLEQFAVAPADFDAILSACSSSPPSASMR